MFHMKTASVRDLRHDFARVLAWTQAGEQVAITLRRQPVARLVPLPRGRRVKRPMPDIAARLKRVFGPRVISDRAVRDLLDYSRGSI
jgi:antitoxin (DNA-binding transcriptional repressor) of toxin-antitoxin stability system